MNSAGAVAVRVRKKRQCAGVDNNHTKMLSAVTAYIYMIPQEYVGTTYFVFGIHKTNLFSF